eukprot:443640-Rhodomonas_salina.1
MLTHALRQSLRALGLSRGPSDPDATRKKVREDEGEVRNGKWDHEEEEERRLSVQTTAGARRWTERAVGERSARSQRMRGRERGGGCASASDVDEEHEH